VRFKVKIWQDSNTRYRLNLLSFIVLLFSISSFAQDIFVIKKSLNPKNVLHFKANINNCKLTSPAISAYWVMGEENAQVESLTNKEKPYFQPKISYSNSTEVDFSIGAMEEMGCKIPDQTIKVRLENCRPKAFLEIDGSEIQLTDINVSVNLFMSVSQMTINGVAPNGSKISKKIKP
jgi:hypothetical protein